jgi:hypothetical protein
VVLVLELVPSPVGAVPPLVPVLGVVVVPLLLLLLVGLPELSLPELGVPLEVGPEPPCEPLRGWLPFGACGAGLLGTLSVGASTGGRAVGDGPSGNR